MTAAACRVSTSRVRNAGVAAMFLAAAVALVPCVASAQTMPALVPQPQSVKPMTCRAPISLDRPLRFPKNVDPGGFEVLRDRWIALGIPAPFLAEKPDVVLDTSYAIVAFGPPRAGATETHPQWFEDTKYSLRTAGAVRIAQTEIGSFHLHRPPNGGQFDALMTLAQLPQRRGTHWTLPCVAIDDEPALSLRAVSDDVSRGPFPTMGYAKRRIRELAALKINAWSPYMEQVFFDPRYPFVAFPNSWTAAQLRELANYALRFHVDLIPEQQTFAHMHEALKWQALAPLAELPHGYLVAESDPRTYAYLERLIKAELAATNADFFHLGSDEPIDLGRGRTPRTAQAFADHVKRVTSFVHGTNVHPIIWDDAIQQDHSLLALLPNDVTIATFHYGVEATYRPYLDTIANAGFEQLVAPGAANWNEIYPDLQTSYTNVARFLGEAKTVKDVGGMFMTVWHDDGETLYDATWPALAYAAATAWQAKPVDDATWHRTFARVFFGSDDPSYARDLGALEAIRPLIRTTPSDPPDYLFWHDPFDPALQSRAQTMDLAGIRTRAESVLTHLWNARPPLNAGAAAAMKVGALRYDALARRLQIGKEARDDYDDARAHATGSNDAQVYRSLGVAKYLCWEMRDAIADIEPRYAAAWRAESTEPGLTHVLPRYRAAENAAQRCADRIDVVMREDYLRNHVVPAWDEVMGPAR